MLAGQYPRTVGGDTVTGRHLRYWWGLGGEERLTGPKSRRKVWPSLHLGAAIYHQTCSVRGHMLGVAAECPHLRCCAALASAAAFGPPPTGHRCGCSVAGEPSTDRFGNHPPPVPQFVPVSHSTSKQCGVGGFLSVLHTFASPIPVFAACHCHSGATNPNHLQ